MHLDSLIQTYNAAIMEADAEDAKKIVRSALDQGLSAEEVLQGLIIPAMEVMLQEFSQDMDHNLAQHYLAAHIADEMSKELFELYTSPPLSQGKIVIGSAYGDMHTLGKRIVSGCLRARQIDVIDLGVNVTAEDFVENAVKHGASVIGISAMMSHTARGEMGCLKVRQILNEKQLENQIKIIVGGAPFRFDPELYLYVGADAYADNALRAGQEISRLIKESQNAYAS